MIQKTWFKRHGTRDRIQKTGDISRRHETGIFSKKVMGQSYLKTQVFSLKFGAVPLKLSDKGCGCTN